MSTKPSKGPYSFRVVLEKLATAGHTQLWLSSSTGKEGGNLLNDVSGGLNSESVWVMPIIMNRDGFMVAERRGGIHDWFLCGNWESNALRAYSCSPAGVALEAQLNSINEKAALLAIINVAG